MSKTSDDFLLANRMWRPVIGYSFSRLNYVNRDAKLDSSQVLIGIRSTFSL